MLASAEVDCDRVTLKCNERGASVRPINNGVLEDMVMLVNAAGPVRHHVVFTRNLGGLPLRALCLLGSPGAVSAAIVFCVIVGGAWRSK